MGIELHPDVVSTGQRVCSPREAQPRAPLIIDILISTFIVGVKSFVYVVPFEVANKISPVAIIDIVPRPIVIEDFGPPAYKVLVSGSTTAQKKFREGSPKTLQDDPLYFHTPL